MTVQVIDLGLDRILGDLSGLGDIEVSIGYMDPTPDEVISRAAHNEFGTVNTQSTLQKRWASP